MLLVLRNQSLHRKARRYSYPGNDLLNLLLMTLHLEDILDLRQRQILLVPKTDNFIKRTQQFKRIPQNLPFIQRSPTNAADDLREEMQRINVLEDVGALGGDEDHVHFLEGLVDVAHTLCLDRRVLCALGGELGERGEERFDARLGHLAELTREDG